MTEKNPIKEINLWIVWVALLTSHLVYLVVVFVVKPQPRAETTLVMPLIAVAACLGIASIGIQMTMTTLQKVRGWVQGCRQKGASREAAELLALRQLLSVSVIGWALSEAITILGLVLTFVGQIELFQFFIFLGIGVVVHLVGWPKTAAVKEAIGLEYGN